MTLLALTTGVLTCVFGGAAKAETSQNSKIASEQKSPKQEPKKEDNNSKNDNAIHEKAAAEAAAQINDPLEPINRVFFFINRAIDGGFLKPGAIIYNTIVPPPAREGIGNFLDNLIAPVSVANHLLQANPEGAVHTIARFIINTTLGIGGLFDIAKDLGLEPKKVGFDDTLTVWGFDRGPYLMLPIFGPYTFRSAFGLVGDYYLDPYNYYYNNKAHRAQHYMINVRTGVTAIHNRSQLIDDKGNDQLEELEKSSEDYYAMLRSISIQRAAYRDSVIKAAIAARCAGEGKAPEAESGSGVTESPKPEGEGVVSSKITESPKPSGDEKVSLGVTESPKP